MLTFNNITASSFAADTQQGAGRRRPRHREALSCSQCRDRKVRCDRKQPCKQCQTRGLSNSCSYGSSKDHSAHYTNGSSAATITTTTTTNNNNHNNNNATGNGASTGNGTSHHAPGVNGTANAGGNNNHLQHQYNHSSSQQQQPPPRRSNNTEPSSPLSSASAESDVRKRLDRLELLLAASSSHHTNGHDESRYHEQASSVSSAASLPARNAIQCPQGPLLSVKTRFIGGTHWMAACNNMPVLKAMLNKSTEFDASHNSFAEIKAWTRSMNAVPVSYQLVGPDAASLSNLLPARSTCEAWVRTYHQTYRHIYDIVDELTLESIMEKVWRPGANEDATIICIVLMLVCLGMQSEESERLNGRRLARYVEQFVYTSGLVYKPCIGSMKVLLLLTLLKTIACSDTESLDSLSGVMGLTTQVAMAMGLHRNPSAFGNITSYHAEIRKRLWSVYFRLSFEHCMRTGVPMALQPEDTDVGVPMNVNLTDIASDGETEIQSKELPVQTDATFGIIAMRLAAIVAPYQRAICSAGSGLPPSAIKHLRDAYHNLLTEAPMYMRPGAKTANSAEEIQQAFLTIVMHSTSLVVSLHFVINTTPEAIQKQHLLTVWEHSLSVLHSFQLLSQKSRHIQTLAYQLLWSDACRAAFSAGMALNRLRIHESKSIMAARLQHTLIPFQESLIKYLAFMSRFWFQSAHLGPTASKNSLLLAVVVAVTARLFCEGHDVSDKELVEVGARSVAQTVDSMKIAMKRRHSFPMSPEASVSSASHSTTRMIGDSGRSQSSPNMNEWPTTTSTATTTGMFTHTQHGVMMDPFVSIFGHPSSHHAFSTPDPTSVSWTPDVPWDQFEYAANSASLSPVSGVPARQATSSYVDGLISPPIAAWSGTSQWVEDVGMYNG